MNLQNKFFIVLLAIASATQNITCAEQEISDDMSLYIARLNYGYHFPGDVAQVNKLSEYTLKNRVATLRKSASYKEGRYNSMMQKIFSWQDFNSCEIAFNKLDTYIAALQDWDKISKSPLFTSREKETFYYWSNHYVFDRNSEDKRPEEFNSMIASWKKELVQRKKIIAYGLFVSQNKRLQKLLEWCNNTHGLNPFASITSPEHPNKYKPLEWDTRTNAWAVDPT